MVVSDVRQSSFARYMPDDWRLLISAFSAANGIGWLSLLGLPFLIGSAMTSLNLNEAQAGLLVTLEFVGIMLASLATAPFMGRADRRQLAVIAALIALSANAVSIFIQSYEILLLIRPLAGVGAGIAIACGNAAVSNSSNPERFAGHMTILSVILMVVIMLSFSRLGAFWGLRGVYAGITTIIVLMSFGLRHLPRGPLEAGPGTAPAQSTSHNRATITAALMLAAFFAFSLRDTLAWAFLERIGLQVGYSSEEIGNLLSIQAMFGIVGPLAASIVGSRFGLRPPLTIGILLSGLVTFAISRSSGSQWTYTLATTFQPCTYFFTLAYLTALAAELDPLGRVVAGSGSALMAGVAIGPAVGGALIVSSNGYTSVGWAIIACVSATFLFSLLPILAAQRSKRGRH